MIDEFNQSNYLKKYIKKNFIKKKCSLPVKIKALKFKFKKKKNQLFALFVLPPSDGAPN